MNICNNCILPSTYPGISFNEENVCNYCLNYKKTEVFGIDKLKEFIEKKRDKNNKYDAIVALSGGRDSTYSLWYYVRKMNLRVIAYTIDNGFIPEHTWKNIKRAVQILGVDHIITKHNYLKKSVKPVLLSFIKKPSPSMVSILCLGCRIGFVEGVWKTARKYNIPLVLAGGGEPEVSFATAFFTTTDDRLKKMLLLFYGFFKEFLSNPRYLVNIRIPYLMIKEYLYNYAPYPIVKKIIYPQLEYYSLFRFIYWDEEEIMNIITKELKWEKYKFSEAAWRSDCKLNLLKNYFYYNLLGFSKNDELAANLVRQGKIKREKALERVKKENIFPKEFFEEFSKELNIDLNLFKKFEKEILKG